MNIFLNIIFLSLGALGTYIIIYNDIVIYRQITKKTTESWIPVFGGLLVFIALFEIPYDFPWYLKLLPFIVDWGCIPGLTHTLIFWIYIVPKWKREGKIK